MNYGICLIHLLFVVFNIMARTEEIKTNIFGHVIFWGMLYVFRLALTALNKIVGRVWTNDNTLYFYVGWYV